MQVLAAIARLVTLRRVSVWDFPGTPKATAQAWLASALVPSLIVAVPAMALYNVAGQFALSAATMLAALLAAWLLRGRIDGLRLAFAFLILCLIASVVRALVGPIFSYDAGVTYWTDLATLAWAIAAACRLVGASAGWFGERARALAYLAVAAAFALGFQWSAIQVSIAPLLYEDAGQDSLREIDEESLWTAQPHLVAEAVAGFDAPHAPAGRTFVVAVAAGGSQQLFGREAEAAKALLERKFAAGSEGVLLSNATKDLERVPLANRTNLAATVAAIGQRYDSGRDLAVIYLTSHGSRAAELTTDLPDYSDLAAISASFLADTLDKAGISRRVVIVSACYAGTWIKPLATADTIVITAAASDRTSFGCDDSREYTVFGEALVEGTLAEGSSLRQAFEAMKRRIDRKEARSGARHSLPQAYVGARMGTVWNAAG